MAATTHMNLLLNAHCSRRFKFFEKSKSANKSVADFPVMSSEQEFFVWVFFLSLICPSKAEGKHCYANILPVMFPSLPTFVNVVKTKFCFKFLVCLQGEYKI